MTQGRPLLAVRGLVAGYHADAPVLFGISLALSAGAATALLGRNGMGKSTLLKVLMGLVPASAGSIELVDESILGWTPEAVAARGVAYVPQGRGLFAALTVEENLLLGALGRDRRARAVPAELYERFPILHERRRQPAASLSGGEQQQLAIARALASRPRLLLLDEPSEGIQPSLVLRIADTLRQIVAEDGLTLLVVEQNLALVQGVASTCIFLENGVIAETRPTVDLRADPALAERYLGV